MASFSSSYHTRLLYLSLSASPLRAGRTAALRQPGRDVKTTKKNRRNRNRAQCPSVFDIPKRPSSPCQGWSDANDRSDLVAVRSFKSNPSRMPNCNQRIAMAALGRNECGVCEGSAPHSTVGYRANLTTCANRTSGQRLLRRGLNLEIGQVGNSERDSSLFHSETGRPTIDSKVAPGAAKLGSKVTVR
jgi:hypothetical protein